MNDFEKKQIIRIKYNIKKTVGENNYKLALAITGRRPGKIKDVIMSSSDGEILLKYIKYLEKLLDKGE